MTHDSDIRKAQVQDYFSRTAENYVHSVSHSQGSDLARLIALGEWGPNQRALDIATGGGHTALAVAPHVAQIVVTDLTPRMLEKASAFLLEKGVTNARFQTADAEKLPFEDASFDCVTCRIAPHHFPNISRAVQEVARVLKSGGIFLLIDALAPGDAVQDNFINTIEKWRDPSHGRSCTIGEWRAFFTQAGLHIEAEEQFRRTHHYDDWTARAQMSASEKAHLEKYILSSAELIRHYFAVTKRADGRLESLSGDYILLKGRKVQ